MRNCAIVQLYRHNKLALDHPRLNRCCDWFYSLTVGVWLDHKTWAPRVADYDWEGGTQYHCYHRKWLW